MPTTPRGRHRAELAPAEHEALRLLRLSVAGLVEREPELVLAIHQLLLVRMPEVTRLRGTGRPIAGRLADALLQAASVDDPARSALEVVRRAGAENRADGFGPEHEAVVGDVLLQAVRTVHQGTWSGPLRAGWVAYVRWLNEQLGAGAVRPPERVRAPGRAARA